MKLWLKKLIMRFLFAEVANFINELYASVPGPSYYIRLPDMPHKVKRLLE